MIKFFINQRYILLLLSLITTLTLSAQDIDDEDVIAEDSLDIVESDTIPVDTVRTLTFDERMQRLLEDKMLKKSMVGMQIYDLTGDSIVYSYNEKQTLRPASTMKVMTAITALDKLGGSYRLSTSLKANGTIVERRDTLGAVHHKVFVGDLTLRGGMDPRFAADDMRAFIESLQKQRIDSIFGTIKRDISFKEDVRLGAGWCWDDKNPTLTPLLWERKDMFMDKFRQELREAGIVIVAATAAPRDSAFLADLERIGKSERVLSTRYHSIDQILAPMMKTSDNLYAECLFYQIAAAVRSKNATAKDAASVMNALVRKQGLTPSDYNFADGSGLSLYNYQSAELQVKMLAYAYNNKNIYTHLLPSLPVAGVDGTLSKRMTNMDCRGKVKAKTGTVKGVSSLAGYVFTRNGNVLCFSIINQGVLSSSVGRNFQDRVCNVMYDYGMKVGDGATATDEGKAQSSPSQHSEGQHFPHFSNE